MPEPENELKRLLASAKKARVSLAICDLASGFQLLASPDLPFHPASTFKVGVMMEVYHQAALGEFSLDDLLPIRNSFISIADQTRFCLNFRAAIFRLVNSISQPFETIVAEN